MNSLPFEGLAGNYLYRDGLVQRAFEEGNAGLAAPPSARGIHPDNRRDGAAATGRSRSCAVQRLSIRMTTVSGWKKSYPYIIVSLLAAPFGGFAHAEICKDEQVRFDAALQKRDFTAAMGIEKEIAPTACGGYLTSFRARRAALQVEAAEGLRGNPKRSAEREALILQADEPRLLWTAAYLAGELYKSKKQYDKAADAFERAISIAGDKSLTPQAPDTKDWKEMLALSYESKALAAGFVSAGRTSRGLVAGSLGEPSNRALKIEIVPLPIQFETGRDDLTPEGVKYASELAEAIKQQGPSTVVLEGHTDPRGSDAYNLDLSERRVKRVARFLAENGVTAQIVTEAKGKREPFTPPDASDLSQEQIWALNRRVVWRRD
jgi:outer membrane protein OmpA-like peptidoglycan-associated protein